MNPALLASVISGRRRVSSSLGGGSGLAAWNDAAVNTWKQISGTALSSVEPSPVPAGSTGPQSKVEAWTGWALNTQTDELFSACCGGHTDYSGNEVDRIKLSDASPAWTQQLAPSATVSNGDYYGDGRPSAVHNYYMVEMDESANRVVLFGGSRYLDGAVKAVVDGYNPSGPAYLASGTYPNIPSPLSGFEVKAVCRDPRNGNVFMSGNFHLIRWNRAANTWTDLGARTGYAQYTASAFDSTRNRILFLGNGASWLWDVDAGTESAVTITGSTALVSNTMQGMVYEPSLDRFIVSAGDANGAVFSVHPTTFAAAPFSTTGGSGMPAESKPCKRFLYVPSQQGIVWAPSYSGNLWFLRTH